MRQLLQSSLGAVEEDLGETVAGLFGRVGHGRLSVSTLDQPKESVNYDPLRTTFGPVSRPRYTTFGRAPRCRYRGPRGFWSRFLPRSTIPAEPEPEDCATAQSLGTFLEPRHVWLLDKYEIGLA